MKKEKIIRIVLYLIGMVVLAFGIVLNTKCSLGVSPIVSVSFCLSYRLGLNFGDVTMVWYCSFVVVEILLQLLVLRGGKKAQILNLLQIAVSILVTRFMNLFSAMIPVFEESYPDRFAGSLTGRLCFLAAAIVCTGIGAALSLQMRVVPNPGDGIVQAISDSVGKSIGFVKNVFDCSCVALACILSLLLNGRIIGIGVGTLLAMLGVGRVVAVFNHLFMGKLLQAAGMPQAASGKSGTRDAGA